MAPNSAKQHSRDRLSQFETRKSDPLYVSNCYAKPTITIITYPCEAFATALLSPLPERLHVDLEHDTGSSSSYPPRIGSKQRIPMQVGTAPSTFSHRISTVEQGRMSATMGIAHPSCSTNSSQYVVFSLEDHLPKTLPDPLHCVGFCSSALDWPDLTQPFWSASIERRLSSTSLMDCALL